MISAPPYQESADQMPQVPSGSVDIPSVSGIGSDSSMWHAGGGGSREVLHNLRPENLVDLPPPTMEDYIQKYWKLGALALVGIIVLKKL